MVYEIEDYYGNTLCAFEVKKGQVEKMKECSLADVDGDYIFETNQQLTRIQLDYKLKRR